MRKSKSRGLNKANIRTYGIYERIRKIIEEARGNVARAINTEMVMAYWQIGRELVEDEQRGKSRAGYGKEVLKKLSDKLTADFGRGSTNLICAISGRFTWHTKNVTHCVTN
jgi:Pyruvate/2-oxoacid:ferredoxin oxidoreductase gamma subunit